MYRSPKVPHIIWDEVLFIEKKQQNLKCNAAIQ